MEIVGILQLVLLIGLVVAVGYLLFHVRKVRPPQEVPEKDDETQKQDFRLRRGQMALARRRARYSVGG